MERITLHVPVVFNTGSPVPAETLEAYKVALRAIAAESLRLTGRGSEGVTVISDVTGVWWDADGREYIEPYLLYEIDVAAVELAWNLARELAASIRVELAQFGVYITGLAINAEVVTETTNIGAETAKTGTETVNAETETVNGVIPPYVVNPNRRRLE